MREYWLSSMGLGSMNEVRGGLAGVAEIIYPN